MLPLSPLPSTTHGCDHPIALLYGDGDFLPVDSRHGYGYRRMLIVTEGPNNNFFFLRLLLANYRARLDHRHRAVHFCPLIERSAMHESTVAALKSCGLTRSILVSCQLRENYGAHSWDGEGKCPQYWKSKGAISYIVRNVPMAPSFTSSQGVQRIDALITDVVQDCFIRSDSHEATDNPTWITLTPSTDLSDLLMGRGTEYEWEKLLKQHQANIGWERRHNGGHYTRTEPFGS